MIYSFCKGRMDYKWMSSTVTVTWLCNVHTTVRIFWDWRKGFSTGIWMKLAWHLLLLRKVVQVNIAYIVIATDVKCTEFTLVGIYILCFSIMQRSIYLGCVQRRIIIFKIDPLQILFCYLGRQLILGYNR